MARRRQTPTEELDQLIAAHTTDEQLFAKQIENLIHRLLNQDNLDKVDFKSLAEIIKDIQKREIEAEYGSGRWATVTALNNQFGFGVNSLSIHQENLHHIKSSMLAIIPFCGDAAQDQKAIINEDSDCVNIIKYAGIIYKKKYIVYTRQIGEDIKNLTELIPTFPPENYQRYFKDPGSLRKLIIAGHEVISVEMEEYKKSWTDGSKTNHQDKIAEVVDMLNEATKAAFVLAKAQNHSQMAIPLGTGPQGNRELNTPPPGQESGRGRNGQSRRQLFSQATDQKEEKGKEKKRRLQKQKNINNPKNKIQKENDPDMKSAAAQQAAQQPAQRLTDQKVKVKVPVDDDAPQQSGIPQQQPGIPPAPGGIPAAPAPLTQREQKLKDFVGNTYQPQTANQIINSDYKQAFTGDVQYKYAKKRIKAVARKKRRKRN